MLLTIDHGDTVRYTIHMIFHSEVKMPPGVNDLLPSALILSNSSLGSWTSLVFLNLRIGLVLFGRNELQFNFGIIIREEFAMVNS